MGGGVFLSKIFWRVSLESINARVLCTLGGGGASFRPWTGFTLSSGHQVT